MCEILESIFSLLKSLWGSQAFQTFFGIFLGFAGAVFLERNKKPKLSIKLMHPINHQRPIPFRTLAVLVCNEKPPESTSWFTHREQASAVTAQIRFLCEDGREYLSKPMPCRWAGSPQPSEILREKGIFTDYSWLSLMHKEVFPGIDEQLDVAARFPGEDECYGFTNSSYFQNPWGKDANFKLDKGRYLIEVQVLHTGGALKKRFLLRNDVPYGEFKLEEVEV